MSISQELPRKQKLTNAPFELNRSSDSRVSHFSQKHFILFQDLHPHLFLPAELLTLFSQKISTAKTPKLVSFTCSKKLKKNDIFGKNVFFFDEFYMLDPQEAPSFQDEYSLISYSESEKQCNHIVNSFLKDLNTDLPTLNKSNYPVSPQINLQNSLHEHLTPFDFLFLQNYRVLMSLTPSTSEFDFTLIFPAFNFVYESVAFPCKLQSSPLAKRLLNKDPANEIATPTFGFFTMDSTSRLVPLEYNDPQTQNVGLFGFWTYGVPATDEMLDNSKSIKQLVWGLHSYFKKNTKLGPRDYLFKNGGHFYAAFNKGQSVKSYSARTVDKESNEPSIVTKRFKIPFQKHIDVNIDFTMFNPIEKTEFDHLTTQEDVSLPTTNTKVFDRVSKVQANSMSPSPLDLSEIGIQTEVRDSFDEDPSFLKCVQKNEHFYRTTIDKMQQQITLLSQAVFSINQTLNLINLQQHSLPQIPNDSVSKNGFNFIEDHQNNLQDATSKSITVSESSSLPRVSRDEFISSNVLSDFKRSPKHKRYKTQEIQILVSNKVPPSDTLKSDSFSITSSRDQLNIKNADLGVTQDFKNGSTQNLDVQDIGIHNLGFSGTISVKETPLDHLNKINSRNEHSFSNLNNNSIPLLEINKRFHNYTKRDAESDDSDFENGKDFKSIHRKYITPN